MGRPREFDPDRALEAAMEVFWRKGYQHTSVSDLLAAMGINRWSLYETFGDKARTFVRALQLYRERWAAFIAQHLDQPGSPRMALFALVRAMGHQIVDDKLGRGCLIANSAFDLAQLEPDAAALVADSLASLEKKLAGVIRRAQEAGEIGPDRDPHELARFVIATINGIRASGRIERQRARLMSLVELALTVLH